MDENPDSDSVKQVQLLSFFVRQGNQNAERDSVTCPNLQSVHEEPGFEPRHFISRAPALNPNLYEVDEVLTFKELII